MGFSSKRLLKPYSCDFSPCTKDSKDMFVSEFREKSPVDEFLIQKTENGGVPSVRLTSDIYMLFNQKRLDRMSLKSLTDYFESLSIKEPEFSALRSKLGDEQLISFVKSRYIQSPSELMSCFLSFFGIVLYYSYVRILRACVYNYFSESILLCCIV